MLNDTLQKTYGGIEANIRTFSASTLVRYDSYIHSMLALISKKKELPVLDLRPGGSLDTKYEESDNLPVLKPVCSHCLG